jgi:hypothetical protein
MNLSSRLTPLCLPLLLLMGSLCGGCATIRVTDSPHTATEQFLMTVAAQRAIAQLSLDGLRDRLVYVDSTLSYVQSLPSAQDLYVVAELRARLLREGVRLTTLRTKSDVVVEIRTGALGIDRLEYLLGLPATNFLSGGGQGSAITGLPVSIPELALLKSTKQHGFASVAFIAYREDTGELIAQSGPFIGRTVRDDYWIFGIGPRTIGNIPPAEEGR